MTEDKFYFTVRSAHPVDLASGRMVAEPDKIELSALEVQEPHNKDLIDRRVLVASGREIQSPASTPEALALAEKEEVDLEEVTGTGKDNRILVEDVQQFVHEREESEKAKGGSE